MSQKYGWIHRIQGSLEFYAPYMAKSYRYMYANDGSKAPTPRELAEILQKYPEAYSDNDLVVKLYDNDGQDNKDIIYLPNGIFEYAGSSEHLPARFIPTTIRTDKGIHLGKIQDKIEQEIEDFIQNEHVYKEIGIQYKRGLLLYGDPGNGKTATLREIINNKRPKNSIVIFLNSLPKTEFLINLRESTKETLKIFIFEELASVIDHNVKVDRLLDFLDGESSMNKSLVLATTNYPEKIPGNIIDRPSRFDKLIKFGSPDASVRKELLKFYLNKDIVEDDIKITKDLSVAQIKEVAMTSRIKNISIQQASKFIMKHREIVKKEFSTASPIGLSSHSMFAEDDWD